jgi:hypothetical protein
VSEEKSLPMTDPDLDDRDPTTIPDRPLDRLRASR